MLEKMEEWYRVDSIQIRENGGEGLLKKFHGSIPKLISSVFSEHRWNLGKFSKKPREFWEKQKKREFMDYVAKELKIKEMKDWYEVTSSQIRQKGGEQLLLKYDNSAARMISSIFKEHNWNMRKFTRKFAFWENIGMRKRSNVSTDSENNQSTETHKENFEPKKIDVKKPILAKIPAKRKGYWDDIEVHKRDLNLLAKELNIQKMEDWYRISQSQVEENGGRLLLQRYRRSPTRMVTSILNEHKWDLQKFINKPNGIWDDLETQKICMEKLTKELNIKEMEDWYSVNATQIIAKGGSGLLKKFMGSPSRMITTVLNDHDWDLKRFASNPRKSHWKSRGFWDDLESQRGFMDYLAKQLNIVEMEDWYRVNLSQISENGGIGLLERYQRSPVKMITSILNHHDWDILKFSSKPKGMWKDSDVQRDYMEQLAKELNIVKMDDWYDISVTQIREKNGGNLLDLYQNSPVKMITTIIKEHEWDLLKFNRKPKGFWDDTKTQMDYFEQLKKSLEIKRMEDWYSLRTSDIVKSGGSGLLYKFQGSISKMVPSILSEHKWNLSKFRNK